MSDTDTASTLQPYLSIVLRKLGIHVLGTIDTVSNTVVTDKSFELVSASAGAVEALILPADKPVPALQKHAATKANMVCILTGTVGARTIAKQGLADVGFVPDTEHNNWLAAKVGTDTGLTVLVRRVPIVTRPDLEAKDLKIAVMTCAREPQYIHATLANLFMSGPSIYDVGGIGIYTDNPKSQYLWQYRHLSSVTIHEYSDEYVSQFLEAIDKNGAHAGAHQTWAQYPTHQRFCRNYHNCLSTNMEGFKGLIVLEDDVLISEDFVLKALEAINETRRRPRGLACISLCGVADFSQYMEGLYTAQYYTNRFHGTQATFFPGELIPYLIEGMWVRGVLNWEAPGDIILARMFSDWQNLYNVGVDIADHVGSVSTGLGGRARSCTFYRRWPEKNKASAT